MSHFFTIAGPQSSGKTTAINHLKNKHKNWYFVDDINPYTVAGPDHLGGAYTNEELETKISDIALIKLNNINDRNNPVAVTETGIFHLVYMKFFGRKKLFEEFLNKYKKIYNQLSPIVIFLDTKPEISFERRKIKYISRIKNAHIDNPKEVQKLMKKYEDIIYHLYPNWIKFYEKMPYQKILIDNSNINKNKFIREIDKTVNSYLYE